MANLDVVLESTVGRLLAGERGCPGAVAWPREVLEAAMRLEFRRLRGAGRRDGRVAPGLPAVVVGGFHSGPAPLGFAVVGHGEELAVLVGTVPGKCEGLCRSLQSLIGGPRADRYAIKEQDLERAAMGCLLGIPRGVGGPVIGLDLLIDGLMGRTFVLLVLATPEPGKAIQGKLAELRGAAESIEREYLQLGQQGNIRRDAVRARNLLDRAIQRLEAGQTAGMWRTSVLLGAEDEETVSMGLAALAGAVSEAPEKTLAQVRGVTCGRNGGPSVHSNVLTVAELATVCGLPRRDRPGFAIEEETGFDLDHELPGDSIRIGKIVDGRRVMDRWFGIETAGLCRHGLITGATGAGKTSTAFRVLEELSARKTPFLVLEPAKGEYVELANRIEGLWVLRAGVIPRSGEVPFQMNPFAFPAGFPLHTHIDLVKQAFIASFGLVPPTPYLLESGIHRAYEAAGWNLRDGTHPDGHDARNFPTLEDLLAQIEHVVDVAGYDAELARNLKAALRTRIGNLCLGPKGFALNTRRELPEELLFERPVVIELKHFGADEEKALLMGLLLTRLYEVREARGVTGSRELKHLLVIEEAHRVLRRTVDRGSEESNTAHHAGEVFANVLAEVRAYGQGVLVVEQLPTKLLPDVIRQANVKMLHRLGSKEDRNEVGDNMLLSDGQKRAVATLGTGEAVIHTDGMDGAVRVKVPVPDGARRAGIREGAGMGGLSEASRERVEDLVRRARFGIAGWRAAAVRAADAFVLALLAGATAAAEEARLRARLAEMVAGRERSEELSLDEILDLAVDESLTRRAACQGRGGREFRALARGAADWGASLEESLPRLLRQRTGPFDWCDGCPAKCLFRYEGEWLARDTGVREALSSVEAGSKEDWLRQFRAAVKAGLQSEPGMVQAVPAGLEHCVLGFVLDDAGVDADAAAEMAAVLAAGKDGDMAEQESGNGRRPRTRAGDRRTR